MRIQTGAADVVLAGGVESMSNIEYYSTTMRKGSRAGNVKFYDRLDRGRERSQPEDRFGVISGMIETAENVAQQCKISREAADEFACESHAKAARAWNEGRFADEVVPVEVKDRKGKITIIDRDEGFREGLTTESLAKLRSLEKGGVVTAGNASQQSDAASACLIVAEDKLAELNLEPIGYLTGWAVVVSCSVARTDGRRIALGFAEWRLARTAIQPIGNTAIPAVLTARKRAIESDATALLGLSFCSSCIALRPNGVAAFPSPSTFVDMFMTIALIAG